MTIRVLLFSVLRERLGASELAVELPDAATGADLLDRLAEAHPIVGDFRPYTRLAVNAAYSASEAVLQDGDEVVLITPTSGG